MQPVLCETLLSSELFAALVTLITITHAMPPFQVHSYVVLVSGDITTQSAGHLPIVSLHSIERYHV